MQSASVLLSHNMDGSFKRARDQLGKAVKMGVRLEPATEAQKFFRQISAESWSMLKTDIQKVATLLSPEGRTGSNGLQ